MCWSGEASTAVATLGFATSAWAIYKKESMLLWLPLAYFTLMEALQAFTYSVIDKCGLPANEMATYLGYLHISFQPFFINMVSLYFIDRRIAYKIAPAVYTICFITAIMMQLQLYPLPWGGSLCSPHQFPPLCGSKLCSFHGNWHIAWELPYNNLSGMRWYIIAGFMMPIIYGSWRFTLYHFIVGPLLAFISTSNNNEWPAIWCLFSLDLLLIISNTRVRFWMHTKPYQFWKKILELPEEELTPQKVYVTK